MQLYVVPENIHFCCILSFKNCGFWGTLPSGISSNPLVAGMDTFSDERLLHTAISATLFELKQELYQGFKSYFLYGCFPIDNSIAGSSF